MFFLTTHILIGKYYPNLLTQFIIGCTFYIVSFFIIKDVISDDCFDQYKYYIISLISADALFMLYKIKSYRDNQKHNKSESFANHAKPNNSTATDTKTTGIHSATLTSEMYDIKITHDLSTQDPNNENNIFSTSDEKSDEQSKHKLSNNVVSDSDEIVNGTQTDDDEAMTDSVSLSELSIDFSK